MEPLYLYLHPEALEVQELDLFGIHEPDDSFAAASVWDLRLDAQHQRRLLELNVHADGVLCPWTGPVKVKEGWYEWDETRGDYRVTRAQAV